MSVDLEKLQGKARRLEARWRNINDNVRVWVERVGTRHEIRSNITFTVPGKNAPPAEQPSNQSGVQQ